MRILAPLWFVVVLWTGWTRRPVSLHRVVATDPC